VRASDVVGFTAFAGFGLWWILFPTSVIRLYAWFHRGKARLPGPRGVRLAGAFLGLRGGGCILGEPWAMELSLMNRRAA
jgi:succinate-acetate transporter protein